MHCKNGMVKRTFKKKLVKNKEKVSVGIYIPILMARIFYCDSTHVPVGEDQKQHLELSRDIAQKFNLDFKAHGYKHQNINSKNFAEYEFKDGTKK